MNDPIDVVNKQNCWTVDYQQINTLYKDFVSQKELSAEQKYFPSSFIPSDKNSKENASIPPSMPRESHMIIELDKMRTCFRKLSELIQKNCKRASIFYTSPEEIQLNDFCQDQVKPIVNELQFYFEFFRTIFQRDIKEMKYVFASTKRVNSNKNVMAPGMYKVVTPQETQNAKSGLSSTGMNAASNVRKSMNKVSHDKNSVLVNSKNSAKKVAVYVKKNKQTDNTFANVISNNENVIDVDVANASKAKNLLCVSCMQNVLIPCHDKCLAHHRLNASRTLTTKSRTPKSSDITYVVLKTRLDLVGGLPKFKYESDHLCFACERGKSKKASYPPKLVSSDNSKLELLHIDLCGPMRVASINGKKYILVIMDDYSRYTWVYFLHSKDETPEIIKKFIAQAQLNYKAKICKIRTDNGTEFKNDTFKAHYEKLGIMQQFLIARTPQQNKVVERLATACFTQNRSIIHTRYNKTPYKMLRGRKPNVEYFHVFGSLCYSTNDRDDLGKMKPKADNGVFIGGLMYLIASRPDIAYATFVYARYQARPTDFGFELIAYSDADHAGCKDDCKSTSGGLQFLGGKLVSWSLKKQYCTAMSTVEAEYVSLSACCAQVIWMRTQLLDYGYKYNRIPMYCDSKSVIAISCNPVQHSKTKHIDIWYHFIKEHVEKVIIMAHQQLVADVHPDELCPPNKRYDLMDANKKIDLEHVQCPPESKIMMNIIKNHPLRFRRYIDKVGMKILDWMISEEMKQTEHYRIYTEVFGIDVPLILSSPTESTQGIHRTPSVPRLPTPKVDASASTQSTVIRLHRRFNFTRYITRQEHVVDDSSIHRNDEHNPSTRLEPMSDKESTKVGITDVIVLVNVYDEEEEEDEITEKVYELKRREKGKNIEESRITPFPTPIRSHRIHTNLVSSDTEKLQELRVPHTTPSSSSTRIKLSHTNRLLSFFKVKPTRFKRYKSYIQELHGRYGYLFEHPRAKFMPRKSFVTLVDHLHEAIADSLPTMVDKHIKEQVPELVHNQVPLYVAEGLILERQKTKEEMKKMIAKAILQERGNIQAQISSQIQQAITDSYASDDDEIPTKQVSQDIMKEVSMNVDKAKLKKIDDEMLRQRCTSRDEHQYHIDQMKNFLKSNIVWESHQSRFVVPKERKFRAEKIVLSLHKFPAVVFNDDDIEEQTSRWIIARRANDCIVSITEPDFKNLNKNDIEEMYLLIMNEKKVNLTAPTISFPRIEEFEMFSIIYETVHGIIYKNSKKEKRVIRHSEIHKFCDATLNRVVEGLKSYNNDVRYGYNQRDLTKDEVEYLKLFEEEIEV
nr:retrovirus-related Pol polyprotein from transposon TNT 1-94 [Tanacetum cinerariifolium]